MLTIKRPDPTLAEEMEASVAGEHFARSANAIPASLFAA